MLTLKNKIMSNILGHEIEAILKVFSPQIERVDIFAIPEQTTEFCLSKIPTQRICDLYKAFIGYDCYCITNVSLFLFNK